MDYNTVKDRFRDRRIIFYILTILILLFIWSNSMDDPVTSYSKSDKVLKFVSKILTHVLGNNHYITLFYISHVRKIAHFTEYMVLGSVMTTGMKIADKTKIQHFYNSLSFSVIAAVIDEYIQIYSGRGSSIKDVIIDFSGYLTGTMLTVIIICIIIIVKMMKKDDRQY